MNKILEVIFSFAVPIVSQFTLSFLSSFNFYIFMFVIGFITTGMLLYLKIKENISNRNIFLLLNSFFYLATYLTVRLISEPLVNVLCSNFQWSSIQFSSFTSYFSIGYGISQIFSGLIVSRFGLGISSFFVLLSSIATLTLTKVKSFYIILFLRVLQGIGFSFGQLILSCLLSDYFPKRLFNTLLITILVLSFNVANGFSGFLPSLLKAGINWKIIMRGLSLISAICFSIFFIFMPKKLENSTKQKNEKSWTALFKDRGLVYIVLLGFFTNCAFCVLQDGWLRDICTSFCGGEKETSITNILNSGIIFLIPLTSVLISTFGIPLLAVITTFIQCINMVLFFLFYKNINMLVLTSYLWGVGYFAHCLASSYIGEKYSGEDAAAWFGIANFLAMFFGGAIPQLVGGILVEYSKRNTTVFVTKGAHVLFMMKFFSIPCVIAFVLSLLFSYEQKKVKKV